MATHDFEPALGLHALTPLYDAFTAAVDPGKGFRHDALAHAPYAVDEIGLRG